MSYLNDREIGERVRKLRAERSLSQQELGDAIGVKQYVVSKIENGTRVVTARELVALSETFGVLSSQLIHAEDTAPALLRQGDADSTGVVESLKAIHTMIDQYHGIESLASK